MKKVLFALLAFVFSAAVVSAATASAITTNVENVADEKVKIKPEELPDAVKAALNSPDYTGWQISAAYKYTDQDIFEVELKNGEETMAVKFDKDGQKVD